jgi:type II secretory pathway component PulJ
MNEAAMMFAYVAPMSIVAGAAWRVAVKLTNVERKLERLEQENNALRAELRSLDRLLRVLVDSRRTTA